MIVSKVAELGRYDAAVLDLYASDFYAAGFDPGDIVDLRIRDYLFTIPVGTAYSDVDPYEIIFMEIALDGRMLVTINSGDHFASLYGIVPGDPVVIEMHKKAGYIKEYTLRCLTMSGNRQDYDSDEEFANFRFVKAGDIKPGFLYRGMSPINPTDNRNFISDMLLSKTDVRTCINLDDEDEKRRQRYPGYKKTHYSKLKIVPVKMPFSAKGRDVFDKFARIARAIIEDDGPFFIHCRYARDRTGMVCAILEGLCGASFEEITMDSMLSYENIHHIERGSEKWLFQAKQHVTDFLIEVTGERDIENKKRDELKELITNMCINKCGLTRDEIDAVYKKLCD
ncbi:MAG: tyrosine-protein phosphatase [Eubacteriales bacterium]|nr:tyrosine-protein phosphatase [Eubacteriales bacterium]